MSQGPCFCLSSGPKQGLSLELLTGHQGIALFSLSYSLFFSRHHFSPSPESENWPSL